jgi:predicted small integral membrane protein
METIFYTLLGAVFAVLGIIGLCDNSNGWAIFASFVVAGVFIIFGRMEL